MKTPGPLCQQIAATMAQNHPEVRDGAPLENLVLAYFRGLRHGLLAGLLLGLLACVIVSLWATGTFSGQ